MRKVIIAGKEVKLYNEQVKMPCPNCGKYIYLNRKFLKKAIAQMSLFYIKRDKAYYVELGLKGMAKRWGKDLGHLRRKYLKHLARQGKSERQE